MPPVCDCHEMFHNIFLSLHRKSYSFLLGFLHCFPKITTPDPAYIMQIPSKPSKVNSSLWVVFLFAFFNALSFINNQGTWETWGALN